MRSSWFIVEVPGNMGLPPSISPRMHPTDQMSTPCPPRAAAVSTRAPESRDRRIEVASAERVRTGLWWTKQPPERCRATGAEDEREREMGRKKQGRREGAGKDLCVFRGAEEDLGRAIPSRRDVVSQHGVASSRRGEGRE
jgi:hypothetical protein